MRKDIINSYIIKVKNTKGIEFEVGETVELSSMGDRGTIVGFGTYKGITYVVFDNEEFGEWNINDKEIYKITKNITELPTAKEMVKKWDEVGFLEDRFIEFAKLHVKKALEKAAKNAYVEYIDLTSDEVFDYTDVITDDNVGANVNKESILNAYPLNNIK